jgi:hypothetical protein
MSSRPSVCAALVAAAVLILTPMPRAAEAADPPALRQAIEEQCKPLKPLRRQKCTRTLRREAKQVERSSGRANVFYLPARSMAVGMTDGMVAGLTDGDNQEALERMLTSSSEAMARTLVETLKADLPEADAVLDDASARVEQTMLNVMTGMLQDEVVDDAAAAGVELSMRMAEALGPVLEESAVRVAGEASAEIMAHMKPAVGSLLRDEVFPAFADAMNEEFNQKAEALSGHITRGALSAIAVSIATDGGIGEAVELRAVSLTGRILDEVSRSTRPLDAWYQAEKARASQAFWTFIAVIVLLMLLAATLIWGLIRANGRIKVEAELARRNKVEAEDNEEAVLVIASEVKLREMDKGVLALLGGIQDSTRRTARNRRGGAALERIIDSNAERVKVSGEVIDAARRASVPPGPSLG